MANDDYPKGLRPWKRVTAPHYYPCGASANIFKGDLVAIDGTNYRAIRFTAAVNAGPITTPIVGVAAEPSPYDSATTTTLVDVAVFDDPNMVFLVQEDGTAASTHLYQLAGVADATPSGSKGFSGVQELDTSDVGGSIPSDLAASRPLLIIGLAQTFNSDGTANAWGANADVEVVITGAARAGAMATILS